MGRTALGLGWLGFEGVGGVPILPSRNQQPQQPSLRLSLLRLKEELGYLSGNLITIEMLQGVSSYLRTGFRLRLRA